MSFPSLRQHFADQARDLPEVSRGFTNWTRLWISKGVRMGFMPTDERGWPLAIVTLAVAGEVYLTIRVADSKVSISSEILEEIKETGTTLSIRINQLFREVLEKPFGITISRFENTLRLFRSPQSQDIDEILVAYHLALWERDAIELARIGLESLIPNAGTVLRRESIDLELVEIVKIVEARILRERGRRVLQSEEIDWLPQDFWWRNRTAGTYGGNQWPVGTPAIH